jgi:hypothetical protein
LGIQFAAALAGEDLVYGLEGDSFVEGVLHACEPDAADL